VILCGDPAQLPAVDENDSIFSNHHMTRFKPMVLNEVVRQADPEFAGVLRNIRRADFGPTDLAYLSKLVTNQKMADFDPALHLNSVFIKSKRDTVKAWNNHFLNKLSEKCVSFIREYHHRDGTRVEPGSATARAIRKYCKCTLPDVLNVKVGAKVMLTRNLDPANGWHNGTLASVKSINEKSKCIIIETLDGTKSIPLTVMKQVIKLGDDVYIRQQFPLELGWAITIHKVQGRTIDAHDTCPTR
jgi:hypothetical protein